MAESTHADHPDAIQGDFSAFRRGEGALRQLAERPVRAAGTTTSWGSLKKDTDVGTERTVSQYAGTPEEMFVVSVLHQRDPVRKKAIYRKEKKIRFQDPFYFGVLNGWISGAPSFDACREFVGQPQNQGGLVEGVVANHLIRLAFPRSRRRRTFAVPGHACYWRDGGFEADLAYNGGAGVEVPIEVKFQHGINSRDLDGLINSKKAARGRNALMITRDGMSVQRECVMIPASMFLPHRLPRRVADAERECVMIPASMFLLLVWRVPALPARGIGSRVATSPSAFRRRGERLLASGPDCRWRSGRHVPGVPRAAFRPRRSRTQAARRLRTGSMRQGTRTGARPPGPGNRRRKARSEAACGVKPTAGRPILQRQAARAHYCTVRYVSAPLPDRSRPAAGSGGGSCLAGQIRRKANRCVL